MKTALALLFALALTACGPNPLNASATSGATGTDTQTATSTDTVPFEITSVRVDEIDAYGNPAVDVRSFCVQFSEAPQWVNMMIVDKSNGRFFFFESFSGAPTLMVHEYMTPNRWTRKLRPNTVYEYVIAAGADGSSDSYTGEFTTDDF